MKKRLILAVISSVFIMNAYSQNNTTTRLIDDLETATFGAKSIRKSSPETQGSPYLKMSFFPAKIEGISKVALMRYDVFNDEFEFINSKKDTLILNKVATFNPITFSDENVKYQLVNYTKKNKPIFGYLINVYQKSNCILFKKQNIIFVEKKVNSVPFETIIPAKFVQTDDTYYFKNEDKDIIEFPKNRKGLVKMFPEKKSVLEDFIKQHNIDFEKESDLIKIIDFLMS
ncbi:hypothetical protein EZL74_04650 [Flavobacterium silvisoli]|uniref:Uncharacterized protein n=1 Tax=Flavobacterium silvisoli TaxID=2529433 RepID=A0A4Q9Z1C1_9FLAO|nr:hypothetical protein [Flavobacterium silvisoli]TBX70040.1 hypothetical protein EZL74_04650 [Flavobacterium silvisoli]